MPHGPLNDDAWYHQLLGTHEDLMANFYWKNGPLLEHAPDMIERWT